MNPIPNSGIVPNTPFTSDGCDLSIYDRNYPEFYTQKTTDIRGKTEQSEDEGAD